MYSLLIADDEALERNALRLIINRSCPAIDRILDAANGTRVIALCKKNRPDIIFLDIRMPGLSGLEAAREIRTIHPGARIVFLTAYNEFDYAHEAIRIGVDDFLLKPASDERVTEVVNRIASDLDGERKFQEDFNRNKIKLEEVTSLFTSELLASLLERPLSAETIERYFSVMDISFTVGIVIAFRIDYASYPMKIETPEQKMLLKRRCLVLIHRELEGRMIRRLVHEHEEVFFVLILPGRDSALEYTSSSEIQDLFESITEIIKTELGMIVRVGVSRSFAEPVAIHPAFREAGGLLDRSDRLEPVAGWDTSHTPGEGSSRGELLIREAVNYIGSKYGEEITLDSMAERVRLSSFYFSKIFKQHTGRTFIDFLTAYRISRSKDLLSDPKANVKEVSRLVGYADPNYFARVFKRIEGLTPTEFRDGVR